MPFNDVNIYVYIFPDKRLEIGSAVLMLAKCVHVKTHGVRRIVAVLHESLT